MEILLANTPEQIKANIEHALAGCYRPFSKLMDSESGRVSIVGSGPSLHQNWREIEGDIIACNAAGQFLLERGVVPKYVMIFDADILAEEFVLNPHKDVTYLLASRCHPKLFEHLQNYKVVLWHAKGDVNLEAILAQHNCMEASRSIIGGGGAAVTRAMFVAQALGYQTLHLYGTDSSYTGETHIRKSTTKERHFRVKFGDRVFDTTPWLAAQAEDFKLLTPLLQRIGMRVVVHGEGLIPSLAKAMDLDTDDELKLHQLWRGVRNKSLTLWANL